MRTNCYQPLRYLPPVPGNESLRCGVTADTAMTQTQTMINRSISIYKKKKKKKKNVF